MSDRIVDLSPEKIELSHAGVLVKRGDKFFVIHIVGDHFENYVKMEALDSFVAHSTGGHFCITRYHDSAEVRNKIAARALAYKKENRAFDYDMTLESKDALFCTELVWRAILEATGKDVSPQKVPWRGKTLIGFLPFFRSPNFEPVYLEPGCPAFQKMASLPEKSALSSVKP